MAKVLPLRFQQCFGSFTMLLDKGSSKARLLRHLSNHSFGIPLVQKYISHEGQSFFLKMFKIESGFLKCANKIRRKSFVSEILASEDVAINCLS